MASTPTTGKEQPDSALRAMRVLEALAGMEQPAGLLTIAAAVNLSKTRAYRVLRSLQDHGYVDHADRNGYRIGSRSLALASLIGPRPPCCNGPAPCSPSLSGWPRSPPPCICAAEPTASWSSAWKPATTCSIAA